MRNADLLTSELGDALEVVARGAALRIELPDGVTAEPLSRRRFGQDGRAVVIELGDLVSGQEVELVVKLRFPAGREGERIRVTFSLTDREDALDATEERIEWVRASHGENDRQPRDRSVDRAVAEIYAARARSEATDRNRAGDLDGARRVLMRTARRIREYAGTDAELRAIAEALEAESEEYSARVMEPLELKRRVFGSYVAEFARAADGKSRRAAR